jgi:hypothetical protein
MRPIGFSTGAVARGDFRLALDRLREHHVEAVELSALRMAELDPLVSAIADLDLRSFSFISIHAPSRFGPELEQSVVGRLGLLADRGYPIIVHPDVLSTPEVWSSLGNKLLIENMDKRKPVGRNVAELLPFFEALPGARFCFDVGHARQFDPSMTEASLLLHAFGDRLAEVHISEVNTASRHDPISQNAVRAFQAVRSYIPEAIPIILETLIADGQSDIPTEVLRAREALDAPSFALM